MPQIILEVALFFALLLGPSTGEAQGIRSSRPPARPCETAAWGEALDLAEKGGAESRERLASLAQHASDRSVRGLAERILALWPPTRAGYASDVPLPVGRPYIAVSPEQSAEFGEIDHRVLGIHVTVDRKGCVQDAAFVVTPASRRLREFILSEINKSAFVPARKAQKYVEGKLTMTVALEPKK